MVIYFDPKDFIDKILIKTVNRLNKFIDKNKIDKIKEIIKELELISKNEDLSVQALYILSVLGEQYAHLFDKVNIESIKEHLDSKNVKAKINALIIIGFYLGKNLKTEYVLVNQFLNYLMENNREIIENILFFLTEFVEINPDIIENNSDVILDLLKRESDIEKIHILLDIIDKFKLRNLSIMISIREVLIFLIQTHENKDILLDIIRILSKFIPEIKNIKNSKNLRKNLLEAIESKILLKRHNLIIKNNDYRKLVNTFKNKLKKTIKYEDIYFIYTKDQKKLFFIEFEKSKILNLLKNNRISLKAVQKVLSEVIDNESQLKLFLLNLIHFKLIRGYISEFYFYPFDYVKREIQKKIESQGFIELKEFKYFDPDFLDLIIDDIKSEVNLLLLYSKSKNQLFLLKKIIGGISQIAAKDSFIDLKQYRVIFDDLNFLEIIKNLPRGYLTDYHIRTIWLTNIGKTRIINEINNSRKIGFFDKKKISEKISIPEILLDSYIHTIFDSQLGFWDKYQEIFYYSKYLQDQIDKFKNLTDETIKNQKIEHLAHKLHIDKNHIQLKLNEKIQNIGNTIKSKEEISIKEYMEKTGMDSKRFFDFINGLNITYFKKGDMLYLNEKKISEIKNEVKKQIKIQSKSQSHINLGNFNIKQSIVKEIIVDLREIDRLKGFFYEDENQLLFYTEKGISEKIMENTDLFFVDQLFPGKNLSDDEYGLIEDIIKSLIKNKTLIGSYDKTNRNFISAEIEFSTNYNEAINQFVNLIEYYCSIFEKSFKSIKSILLKNNEIIRPAEVTFIQNSFDELIKSYVRWRSQIGVMKFKQTSIFLKQQGINSKKEFELLSEEEGKKIKSFNKDPMIIKADDTFNAWIHLFKELEQNYGKLLFFQKQMLIKPDDKEIKNKLNELYRYLDLKQIQK